MQIVLPTAVSTAIQKLNNAGHTAYAVGGCVRDSLMGVIPKDWDITTSATPMEMQTVFTDYRTIETGLKHGTLTIIIDSTPLEITTFRLDGDYSDGRHPDAVNFTRRLADDLQRRDFTINAMAYHPTEGLVDLYNGRGDLSKGIIRCVGDPFKRLSEDALRILRALRFASELSFTITDETEDALRQLSPSISLVSVERISNELGKLLCGASAQHVVVKYADIIRQIIPELDISNDMGFLNSTAPTLVARWTALFYCCNLHDQTAVTILRRLRMDNRSIREIKTLLTCLKMPHQTDEDLLRLLNKLDDVNLLPDYLAFKDADGKLRPLFERLLSDNRCYKMSMLAVNGNDIATTANIEGPEVGTMLSTLFDAVIEDKCPNEKTALLNYMQAIKKPVQQ